MSEPTPITPEPPPVGADAAVDDERVRNVELVISTLLRVGVIVSLSVIVAGTLLTFLHHPQYVSSRSELARLTKPGAAFPRTVGQVVEGLKHLQGRAVVAVGLLLLIATPVLRVAVSVFAFIYQEDARFVLITSLVFVLLLLSFFLGGERR